MFDAKNIDVIAKDIRAAMADVAKKHNLKVGPINLRYDDATFAISKIEFASVEATGGVDPVLYNDMKKYGLGYGLTVADIDKTFNFGAKVFTIKGMKGRKVIGLSVDGKMYKFDGADVAAGYKRV